MSRNILSFGPGGNYIDLPPNANTSKYCQAFFPFDRDTSFGTGMVLPDVISGNAGKCNVKLPALSQAQSNPAWGLPSVVGTSPSLADVDARQWFFDTRDSSLTGEGPIEGGWREPSASGNGIATAAGGGRKRRSRAHKRQPRAAVKTQKGRKRGAALKPVRRGKSAAKRTRRGRR